MEPGKLSKKALNVIRRSPSIGIHVISCFEIAILAEKNKVAFEQPVVDWISDALSHPKIQVVPLTVAVAVQCTQLPGNFHRDPADRILAATCLSDTMPLVSKDKLIHEWGHIDVI